MYMNTKKKSILAICEILLAVVVILFIYFLIHYLEKRDVKADAQTSEMAMQPVNEVQISNYGTVVLGDRQYILSHPVKTYLFMGTDASGNEDGVGDEYRGAMADVLMLLVIDEEEEFYEDDTIFMDCAEIINIVCKKKLDTIINKYKLSD